MCSTQISVRHICPGSLWWSNLSLQVGASWGKKGRERHFVVVGEMEGCYLCWRWHWENMRGGWFEKWTAGPNMQMNSSGFLQKPLRLLVTNCVGILIFYVKCSCQLSGRRETFSVALKCMLDVDVGSWLTAKVSDQIYIRTVTKVKITQINFHFHLNWCPCLTPGSGPSGFSMPGC